MISARIRAASGRVIALPRAKRLPVERLDEPARPH